MYDTRESLESLVGKRIRLVEMGPDVSPLPAGATGEVRNVAGPFPLDLGVGTSQVMVKWDRPNEKRTLMLIVPFDKFEIIESAP